MEDDEGQPESQVGVGRMLAFSDGVFAIAFTILVLDLTVPDGLSADELRTALHELLPQFFSALLSFAVIGRFWLAHHQLFDRMRGADTALLVFNTLLLIPIALIPFTAQLLAEYGDIPIAVIIYSATVGAAASMQLGIWLWARRRSLITRPRTGEESLAVTLGLGGAALAFIIAIPVAPLSTTAAQLCWLIALVPGRPFAAWWYARRARSHA